jgi:hypothetical protein
VLPATLKVKAPATLDVALKDAGLLTVREGTVKLVIVGVALPGVRDVEF